MTDWILRHGASLMIFAGGLVAAGGAFFAERQAIRPTPRHTHHFWPVVILVGAIIGGMGSYWGGYQQDQLSSFLSGADSYGYLAVGPWTSTSIEYLLVERGDAPFYDVMIDVRDDTKFRNLLLKKGYPPQAPSSDDLMEMNRETVTSITVGNVGPGQVRGVWTASAPQTEDQSYSISIWARNGLITQELRLHRTDGKWLWATKVWRTSPQVRNGKQSKQSLYELVNPDFPRDKIDWQ